MPDAKAGASNQRHQAVSGQGHVIEPVTQDAGDAIPAPEVETGLARRGKPCYGRLALCASLGFSGRARSPFLRQARSARKHT